MSVETAPAVLEVRNPADGSLVESLPIDDARAVNEIAAELRMAQVGWEAIGPEGRAAWLHRWRDWILAHADELTDLLVSETGKARPDALIEPVASCEFISYYADNAAAFLADDHVKPAGPMSLPKKLTKVYSPYPLVGIITPWNFPITLFLMDAAPALAAGCAVLSKSSEETPLACARLIEGWHEIGAPAVLASVTGLGETGAAVVDAADYVQFTGSTATGRKIGVHCAQQLKPYSLELGGKDPAIVLEDADLDRAVNGIAWGGLFNSGQVCISVERVYVAEPVYDDFVKRLTAKVDGLSQGAGAGSDVGAMVTTAQVDIADRHVREAVEAGARVLTGGQRGRAGNFFEPTVLVDVDHSMSCMTDETFGPTIPVMKVADEDEAIRMANDSPYGLSATVWTKDVDRGQRVARRLEAGAVNINDVFSNLFAAPLPHNGWKESGVGARLGGAYGIHKYCKVQAVTAPRMPTMKNELMWYPYSARRTAVAGFVAKAVSGRGLRQRLGLGGKAAR
ncbi:aldehyde dehydrogenase family protein [Nocardioides humilatus]|uniref:Aldehyde dehydrogenase family protein n=1 Tax=Nocardioides humilatus TaxID=2607660 RepID=A0A5B1LM08_9ACTN|nr:aldehyde dehydrogenase family protein [Nocardioides humilatus]KAA1421722.1 aldehyde dehydrogenase family protein [Nocardioides humilatus]